MDIKKVVSSMMTDSVDGSVSSKRVITFLAFMLCATAFLANLFSGLQIAQFIYDSMTYIVIAGLGFTATEKFVPKRDKDGDDKNG